LAANFLKEKYDVIINGYMEKPAWTNLEKQVRIANKILLLPQLEVVIARNAGRYPTDIMGEEMVKRHHHIFSNDIFYSSFLKLDTSENTAGDTTKSILKIISQTSA
jgi:hypothetical protein